MVALLDSLFCFVFWGFFVTSQVGGGNPILLVRKCLCNSVVSGKYCPAHLRLEEKKQHLRIYWREISCLGYSGPSFALTQVWLKAQPSPLLKKVLPTRLLGAGDQTSLRGLIQSPLKSIDSHWLQGSFKQTPSDHPTQGSVHRTTLSGAWLMGTMKWVDSLRSKS